MSTHTFTCRFLLENNLNYLLELSLSPFSTFRRKMQTSTTIAECKEKVTSAVSPTLVLSSKSSSQNEDSKHQDDIVVLEGNKGTTETGVMENNNDTTEAGILKNNKVTSEAAVMENNKGTTEAVGAMESNKGTNETVGVMENNKGITETVGVMESNKGTNETGVMESNKGTCTETGVTENNKNSTETEVQNAETEGDASLVTSFSNLAVSDPTLVENQEIEREDESKSSENTAQKLLMGSDKEESKVQEGDNESVHGCNNLVVCNEIRRNVEHLPKPITAETGAIPKTNFHNVRHNQIKTKLNEKKISDVKLTEAAAGDSGIVIDGDESEATIPKATCKDLPDLLTQSGHPQSDRTENIPKYKHEKDPKGVVGEVRSTDLSQNREVTSEDTGEIVNENVKDTVDHQLQYTQQMSNLSMDEGDQGDMEKVNALSYPCIYAENQLGQSRPIFTLGPYGKGAGKFI